MENNSPSNLMKLEQMLRLQDANNSAVAPDWRSQRFNWTRAIRMELFELIDHLNWKWWSMHTFDSAEISIELVDIWHFLLSQHLEGSHLEPESIMTALCGPSSIATEHDILREAELAILETLQTGALSAARFVSLCRMSGINDQTLYGLYVAKAILNRFRRDNGYKEGTYIKWWFGREDNTHLLAIASDASNFQNNGAANEELMYQRLSDLYNSVLRG